MTPPCESPGALTPNPEEWPRLLGNPSVFVFYATSSYQDTQDWVASIYRATEKRSSRKLGFWLTGFSETPAPLPFLRVLVSAIIVGEFTRSPLFRGPLFATEPRLGVV